MMVLEKHGGSYTTINRSTFWIPPDGSRPYHVNLVFLRRMIALKPTYKKETVVNAEPVQATEPVRVLPEPTPEPTRSEETKSVVEKTETKVENKESKKKEKSRKKKTIPKVETKKEQGTESKIETPPETPKEE